MGKFEETARKLGGLRLQKLFARRNIKEEIADGNGSPRGKAGLFHAKSQNADPSSSSLSSRCPSWTCASMACEDLVISVHSVPPWGQLCRLPAVTDLPC